ncbi:hypothetical protein C1646_740514 [Rhizophagus diaphanus]|nr:hypothetical protein C1646_740514 [Rhizophagus diaphanus] [Rhizophagus sp. MUCL 43196]
MEFVNEHEEQNNYDSITDSLHESRLSELNPSELFIVKNESDIDTLVLHLQQKFTQRVRSKMSKERLEEWKKAIYSELREYQRYWEQNVMRKHMSESEFLEYRLRERAEGGFPVAVTKNKLKKFVPFEYDIAEGTK